MATTRAGHRRPARQRWQAAPDAPDTDLATTELTLARALVERGRPRDRERARALIEAARTRLRAAGDDGMDALAELERWVAQHGAALQSPVAAPVARRR